MLYREYTTAVLQFHYYTFIGIYSYRNLTLINKSAAWFEFIANGHSTVVGRIPAYASADFWVMLLPTTRSNSSGIIFDHVCDDSNSLGTWYWSVRSRIGCRSEIGCALVVLWCLLNFQIISTFIFRITSRVQVQRNVQLLFGVKGSRNVLRRTFNECY